MSADHILTVGNPGQVHDVLKGHDLKGRGEPRLAMIGRSNVGKSSLLNALLGTKLAQVSNNPGKTRVIHFYLWKEARKIVADLPGYGYANASIQEKNAWAKLIEAYLDSDRNLEQALLLLDSRHGPTELDKTAIQFLSSRNIPVTFIYTKSDTLKTQSARALRHREAASALRDLGYLGDNEKPFWVSCRSGDGLKGLAAALRETS